MKKPSLRKAIDAKCRECIYDPIAAGTWRQQVEECTSKACPLYLCRPRPSVSRGKASNPEKSPENGQSQPSGVAFAGKDTS